MGMRRRLYGIPGINAIKSNYIKITKIAIIT
jgi:hypothetical protein